MHTDESICIHMHWYAFECLQRHLYTCVNENLGEVTEVHVCSYVAFGNSARVNDAHTMYNMNVNMYTGNNENLQFNFNVISGTEYV